MLKLNSRCCNQKFRIVHSLSKISFPLMKSKQFSESNQASDFYLTHNRKYGLCAVSDATRRRKRRANPCARFLFCLLIRYEFVKGMLEIEGCRSSMIILAECCFVPTWFNVGVFRLKIKLFA